MKKLLVILAIVATTAQAQEVKFAVYNTISSGLIGGVGAGFNKHKGQTFFQAFKKGFVKGCVSGTVSYSSRYLTTKTNFVWPSRVLNSIGSSMTYNTVRNNPLFSQINIQFYFGYITLKNKKIGYDLDLVTIASSIYMFSTYNFDLKNTLNSGSLVFQKNDTSGITRGKSFGNCIWYKESSKNLIGGLKEYKILNSIIYIPEVVNVKTTQSIINHEIIHTFQYDNYNFYSPVKINKIRVNLNFALIYAISGTYKCNIFECEANYYGK